MNITNEATSGEDYIQLDSYRIPFEKLQLSTKKDLRRSIVTSLPREEPSIEVFDSDRRRRKKVPYARNNYIITIVRHELENYIKIMRQGSQQIKEHLVKLTNLKLKTQNIYFNWTITGTFECRKNKKDETTVTDTKRRSLWRRMGKKLLIIVNVTEM